MRWMSILLLIAGCAGRVSEAPPRPSGGPATALLAPEPVARAQETEPRRVTLAFRDAHVRDALEAIAAAARGNIIIASNVEGRITATLHDVPWTEAVEAIVKTLGHAAIWERPDLVRVVDP